METKSILQSKTFWIGAGLAAYSAFIAYAEDFASSDPLVSLVAGLLVIVNRYFTSTKINK